MSEHKSTYLLRYKDLVERGIVNNRVTLRRWQARKKHPFPAPIQLGPNSLAWRESEVEEWLQQQQPNTHKRTNYRWH